MFWDRISPGRFMMETYQQMDLFHDNDDPPAAASQTDPRTPVTVTWNLWHGCKKVSPGCANCYMFRRDEEYGKDPTIVHKTSSFSLPVRKYRSGPYKGLNRIPAGSLIYTCFTSDYFIEEADDWRPEAWDMIRRRPDCSFFMITKRFLKLPIRHKSITHEPMLEAIDIRKYLAEYGNSVNEDGSRILESVSCGGESGPKARICDFGWVLNTHIQCVEYGVPFHFHQTGARLRRSVPDCHGGHIQKVYEIPREYQHTQAEKAGLDYGGGIEIPACLSADSPSV